MPTRTLRPPALVLACGALALVLIGWGIGNLAGWWHRDSPAPTADGSAARPFRSSLRIGLDGCTRDWTNARPGAQVFTLSNMSDRPMDVELIATGTVAQKDQPTSAQAHSAQILAEIEGLGPGVTRDLTTSIGTGHFHFYCLPEDAGGIAAPDVTVGLPTNAAAPAQAGRARPATEQELIPYTQRYSAWAGKRLPGIKHAVARIADQAEAAAPGWRARARALWLRAHHSYLTLGAAYGAFGDTGEAIDGTGAGLPRGAADRRVTGFHRVERELWSGTGPASVRAQAAALGRALDRLDAKALQVDALDMGLRAHEISEDAGRLTLTGLDDFGSHSGLDAIAAQNEGTSTVLHLLEPLLKPRLAPGRLQTIERSVAGTARYATALSNRYPHTAPAALPAAERQRLRARMGGQTELLADVAAVSDIRRAE